MKVRSRVSTAKRSERQVANSNVRDGGSHVARQWNYEQKPNNEAVQSDKVAKQTEGVKSESKV